MQLTSKVHVKKNGKNSLSNSHTATMNTTTGLGCSISISKADRNGGYKVSYVQTSAKVSGHTFVNSKTKLTYVNDWR